MRKTSTVTIEGGEKNRDTGKVFQVTEMSADAAERWALRAGFALMNTGIDIPELDGGASMADMAQIGLKTLMKAFSRMDYEQAEPLLNEMMACVQVIPDPAKPNIIRPLESVDIEEVSTRLTLRKAVWDLHVDFFTNAG